MTQKSKLFLTGIILIFISFFFAVFYGRHEQVFLAENTNSGNLVVNLNSQKPLKKELYGFNTNQMNAEYTYSDQNFTTLTSNVKPQNLRFPGGTVANFYHWKTSGFIESELNSTNSDNLNKRNLQNYKRLVARNNGEISFDQFIKLCEKLQIQPVIVLNLYTGSPSESADWVRYVKDKGYKVAGWELGNELYLEAYRNKIPTVATYIEIAKQHAAAMRAVDSNVNVAAVASTTGFHLNQKKAQDNFERAWNDQLARENFFDSYTVHMYTYSRVRQSLPFNQLRGLLFGSSDIGFKRARDYYEKTFGNRKLWITEWNIGNPNNKVANTQLHAMYCGDFFLSMLNSQEQVAIANYHVLAGSGRGFPIFSPRTKEDTAGEGRSVKRACYPVFQLIGETLAKSDRIYSSNFKNVPQFQASSEFENEALNSLQAVAVGKDNQSLFILITNRTPNASRPIIELKGKSVSGRIQYKYVANSDLASSNGGNEVIPGNGKNEITIQSWSGSANELRIPGNSFGVIQLL